MKKLLTFVLVAVLAAPLVSLLGVAVLMNPATTAQASCLAGLVVGAVPDSLEATTQDGSRVRLDRQQLMHAKTIIETGSRIRGVGRDGVVVALMAALTESRLRQLANTSAYPESAGFPNDGNGGDHDSLGLFQMRPASGWGTVAELMDPSYQARAFFGGLDGPNYPSPRGLLDIPNWQSMSKGQAAQSVEVSAFPDRYQNYEPVAVAIVNALTASVTNAGGAGVAADPSIPETASIVFPLPAGTYTRTSTFGPRSDPITGEQRVHYGVDYAAPDGTPILALADGLVTFAGMSGDTGVITIEHTIDGKKTASKYLHMWASGIHVKAGERVIAGQRIGDVGSSGHSTGAHLHLEVHPGGADAPAVGPEPWLAAHHVDTLTDSTGGGPGCAR